MIPSLTWASECDRPQRRRVVSLQVLEIDPEEERKWEAARTSILWRGILQRSGQQAGSPRDLSVENIIGCKWVFQKQAGRRHRLWWNLCSSCKIRSLRKSMLKNNRALKIINILTMWYERLSNLHMFILCKVSCICSSYAFGFIRPNELLNMLDVMQRYECISLCISITLKDDLLWKITFSCCLRKTTDCFHETTNCFTSGTFE